ncbi:XRE family transcriptional regulator [Nostoc linckia z18]|uniref:XRE family transcriptional regulator n=3 Tax=Nostoc linckia TaxID=92942 RepID=A0A9Q5ZGS7_NOSLI|nr:helix-turn-helix transcriptional regulator [Nostoc linckia]PHJ69281.1 XRE family transcriptional regulator [Nostoc linckia z1]PHJ73456.1 XRE family transcriptional regulator [Nostoc linckia z3]PHJ78792.1 XRE family transcriptional regulator [Nostoc linckia z2]PHJ85875.1 XRE family transcriptional regulator [Nostoc linckia z4]PHK01388.1 XRE family transcriptional regulator [Nostoc linckia z7]PHK26299.1 XRE family transcriptional regulator [Nostoc linckia z13]PHK37451.1 XRE family transcrip
MDLKQLRRKAGLRAEEVAASVGVACSTVRNWEQGRTIPTLNIFQTQKLARMYNCSLDELVSVVEETQTRAGAIAS